MSHHYGDGGRRNGPSATSIISSALAIIVVLAGVGYGIYWWAGHDRVEPGNAGVLLDFCNGTQTTIENSQYIWVGFRCLRLAEYPTREYTLDMLGQEQNVPCPMKDQQTIRMDSATAWSVDKTRVRDLYLMRPDVPLTGGSNGNDIQTQVVRSEVRAGIRDACTMFGWEDAYGARRAEFEAKAEEIVQARLMPVGILVRTVSIRDMDPSDQLDGLIQARLQGQREVEASQFQARQAENQGKTEQARQTAAAQLQQQQANDAAALSKIQSEAALNKARLDAESAKVKADSDQAVALAKTNAEAEDIRQKGLAQAAANRETAASITPQMVELERWKKWNGVMPAAGNTVNTTGIVSVPAPAAAAP